MKRENLQLANELDSGVKHIDDLLDGIERIRETFDSTDIKHGVVSIALSTGSKESVEAFVDEKYFLEIVKMVESNIIIQRTKKLEKLETL